MSKNPLVLIILDGFGYREQSTYNAINHAKTPQWDKWWASCPHALLDASGIAVGLPHGQMGNSEVGHMHIGSGRLIPQDLTRINQAIEDRSFFQNSLLLETISALKKSKHTLHVMGLLSPGGVHSHEQHLFAFLKLCDELQFTNVALHLFLDGRDTPPMSAQSSLIALDSVLNQHPVATICSLTGRYYALDRDKRWERLAPLYALLTEGECESSALNALEALRANYQENIHDEFIPPTRIGSGCKIQSGDAVFCFNFRADRIRQLTAALIDPEFTGFRRKVQPTLSSFISMTRYSEQLATKVIFPPMILHHTLGEILAQNGLYQLRIAETEKYAHVTFFFNGGSELIFPNETRLLIPSPHVATYDLKPDMSAEKLTDELIEAINSRHYDVIICNYANADMVGHTGNFNATIHAIETLDRALERIGKAILKVKGHLLITADHGNAELMFDDITQQPHTAHTSDPVPFLYYGNSNRVLQRERGCLTDIAPTLLDLLEIPIPSEMTGTSLFKPNRNQST